MAQVIVEMSSDDAKLLRSMQKQKESQDKVDRSYRKTTQTSRRATNVMTTGTQRVAAGFKSVAGSLVGAGGVTAALGIVTAAFSDMEKQVDESIQKFRGLGDTRRSLAQVARGGQDFQQLIDRADRATSFGITRQQAQNVLFSARSEGFEDSFEKIARASTIIDPEAQARVAGRIAVSGPRGAGSDRKCPDREGARAREGRCENAAARGVHSVVAGEGG